MNIMRMLKFLLVFIITFNIVHAASEHERKSYIVYMGSLKRGGVSMDSIVQSHNDMLVSAIGDAKLAMESKIHSYKKSFNGFAAKLLPHEAEKLSDEAGVLSVFPSKLQKLHTTRSWDFLGMAENTTKRNKPVESNIIVGVLDSGIWMDCPSFSDKGYGPIPSKWKGQCVTGANFTGCNNKVIGAKFYNLDNAAGEESLSPVDRIGHGTHTASTIAGDSVAGTSLYGLAEGTARGGVPSARLAIYKVCWGQGCSDADILAAFDDAIADGVDIISLSIGGIMRDFFSDPIAIGAFHAMKRGILATCSAGNNGPYPGTVMNVAPWILTVAASGMDRKFQTIVKLGNGKRVSGIAVNTFTMKSKMYPLIHGAQAANRTTQYYGNASACDYGTLSKELVTGKIVYCMGNSGQDYTINEYGGAGAIMTLDSMQDTAFTPLIPASYTLHNDSLAIAKYLNSTKNPMAVIRKTMIVATEAPFIASFSSRGPQLLSNILKPDLAAPGIDILAGFTKLTTVTSLPTDSRRVNYNIISGTSMACPHVAAAAAYIKSFHPEWSPAAIKSALMTTATPMKIKDELVELSSGAGQISPIKALTPGLVYDLSAASYIRFLCKQGYNGSDIALLAGDGTPPVNCSALKAAKGVDGLNYPTMQLGLSHPNDTISAVYRRIVTHVENKTAVYTVDVVSQPGLTVRVMPSSLNFSRAWQKRAFKVVVQGPTMAGDTSILTASLEWSSGNHTVRSYVLVYRAEYYTG